MEDTPRAHRVTGTVPLPQPGRLLSAVLFILIQHFKKYTALLHWLRKHKVFLLL